MMPKVCIVVVYFGKWPVWLQAWLRSCSTNPEFDWLILSASQPQDSIPSNVKFVPLSVQELESRVSARVGCEFSLVKGYKLVDLKPAYGHLFEDYLEGYDFWGYTDLDVVYGRLSRFFTPKRLNDFDVLSPSDRLLVGHLTLIRNSPRFREMYTECSGYKDIICQSDHSGFDEKGFHQLVMKQAEESGLRLFLKNMKEEDIILRLIGRGRFLILWTKGRLYDIAGFREICHFHFMESKWGSNFSVSSIGACEERFYITPQAIKVVVGIAGRFEFSIEVLKAILVSLLFYSKRFARHLLPKAIRKRVNSLLKEKRKND